MSGYPPLLGAALRFLLATAILGAIRLVVVYISKPNAAAAPVGEKSEPGLRPNRVQHLGLFGAGLVNGLGYACIYVAEQTLSGGTTAVICATSPFFTLLLARFMGLEPLLLRRVLGMALGLGGVALLFSDGLSLSRGHFQAMLLTGLAAALLWPLYGALLKRYAQSLTPLVSTTYFLFYTGLVLAGLSVIRHEPLPNFLAAPWQAHAGLLYLTVVGSVLAWTVFLWLLKHLELSVVSMLGLLQPVLALGIDLLLHEAQLRPLGYVGAGLVLLGMGISTIRPKPEASDASEASQSA